MAHLRDLYVVGKEVTMGDPSDPIRLWLKKLNDHETEIAIRKANAAKARRRAAFSDENSEEHQAALDAVLDLDKEALITYLVTFRIARLEPVREAELSMGEDSEWSKEGYYKSLRDAWDDGLKDEYARNPEDPEASRVFGEMERFNDELQKILDGERESIHKDLEALSEEELRKEVIKTTAELQTNLVWMEEFRRCEVWLGTFHANDHKNRYFEERAEVDELEQATIDELLQYREAIHVGEMEGKDSRGNPASSDSSEPSEKAEESTSSGPEVVSV